MQQVAIQFDTEYGEELQARAREAYASNELLTKDFDLRMGANALNWAQRKEETWGQYIASGVATTFAMAVGLKDIDPFSWQQIKSKVYE